MAELSTDSGIPNVARMLKRGALRVGVDVGGTNTDAVVMRGCCVLGTSKTPTTGNVTDGVVNAVRSALKSCDGTTKRNDVQVSAIMIGTTHFVNAVVQRKDLVPVAVFRICGPSTRSLPPRCTFPEDLKKVVRGLDFYLDGGFEVNGSVITEVDEDQVREACVRVLDAKISQVVVCGVYSPIDPSQEDRVLSIIHEVCASRQQPNAISVTLSHKISTLGFMERENASILNAALRPLARRTIDGFRRALTQIDALSSDALLFLTQNDGCVLPFEAASLYPITTFASGPTNSARGAAFLARKELKHMQSKSQEKNSKREGEDDGDGDHAVASTSGRDVVVVDIGGTTTDVCLLLNGFPRPSSTTVEVGGVRTNFQIPHVVSTGLGGGSIVARDQTGQLTVGPRSVGYEISKKALLFGGKVLTTTDVAVAAGRSNVSIGDRSLVSHLEGSKLVQETCDRMGAMIEAAVDEIKLRKDPVDVLLCGGGAILCPSSLAGVASILRPPHAHVANAAGAAIAQASGTVEDVISYEHVPRDEAMERCKEKARKMCLANGANVDTISIVSVSETPLSYLPGQQTRVKVKAVGDIFVQDDGEDEADEEDVTEAGGVGSEVTFASDPAAAAAFAAADNYDDDDGGSCDDAIEVTSDGPAPNPAGAPDPPAAAAAAAAAADDDNDGSCDDAANAVASSTSATTSPVVVEKEELFDILTYQPRVEDSEWLLSPTDVSFLALGCGILGTGGGGSPLNASLELKELLLKSGDSAHEPTSARAPVRIVDIDALSEDTLVILVGFMGAPTVGMEKISSGLEVMSAVKALLRHVDPALYERYRSGWDGSGDNRNGDEVKGTIDFAIASIEVGGMNGLTPAIVAAHLNVPVVDCDAMGRAFPCINMLSPLIYGQAAAPCAMSDGRGNDIVCTNAVNAKSLENIMRATVVSLGCMAGLAICPLRGKSDVLKFMIPSTLSKAWSIGRCISLAAHQTEDPVSALERECGGRLLCKGKIVDVLRSTVGGFDRGVIRIKNESSTSSDANLSIEFQNENLVVFADGEDGEPRRALATVPDLIVLVDSATAHPIFTEQIRYGLQVAVLLFAGHPRMATEEALCQLAPKEFGFKDLEYCPERVGVKYETPKSVVFEGMFAAIGEFWENYRK